MNRRTLFKSLIGTGAIAALPGYSAAETPSRPFDPRSVRRVKRWRVTDLKHCYDYDLSLSALDQIAADHLSTYGRVPDTIVVATDKAYMFALWFRVYVQSHNNLEFEVVIDERLDHSDAWYVTEKDRFHLQPIGSSGSW